MLHKVTELMEADSSQSEEYIIVTEVIPEAIIINSAIPYQDIELNEVLVSQINVMDTTHERTVMFCPSPSPDRDSCIMAIDFNNQAMNLLYNWITRQGISLFRAKLGTSPSPSYLIRGQQSLQLVIPYSNAFHHQLNIYPNPP